MTVCLVLFVSARAHNYWHLVHYKVLTCQQESKSVDLATPLRVNLGHYYNSN